MAAWSEQKRTSAVHRVPPTFGYVALSQLRIAGLISRG
jgi:hypothetical protein